MIVLKATQEKILAVLQSVSGIVERRHTLPILANVLIRKTGGNVQLTTSDLEIQIRTSTQLDGDDLSKTNVDPFAVVDDVLRQGIQGISELITEPGLVNLDFADVKKAIREVFAIVDHRDLNEIPPFDRELNPTAENIAFYFQRKISASLSSDVRVSEVTVWETDKQSATYRP